MTRSQKLMLAICGLGALLASGITSIPTTQATSSYISALQAQRAALVAKLAAMQPSLNTASGAANTAEKAYASLQQQVLVSQRKLALLNKQAAALNQQLLSDEATVADAKTQLGGILRATFESTGNDQLLTAILSASTFSQAMDRLRSAGQISQQVATLIANVNSQEQQIKQDQATVKADLAQGIQLEASLASQTSSLMAVLLQRNQLFSMLNGPAQAVAAQIANIDQRIAAAEAPPVPYYNGGGSCGNHFYFGECTWYVASRRCVPWLGNADQWYYAAAAMGFQEGHVPVPGAIVVFWPGGDGASYVGHVAYVEAVGPADGIPAGYFRLSEMNFYGNGGGWDRVSYRTLPNNSGGIQGFIYGK